MNELCQQCHKRPVDFPKPDWLKAVSPGPGVCFECGMKNIAASCLDDGPDATIREIHENEQHAAFFLPLIDHNQTKP